MGAGAESPRLSPPESFHPFAPKQPDNKHSAP